MNTAITTIATFALAIATGFVVAQTAPNPASVPPPPGTKAPPADEPATPRSNMTPTMGRPGMPTTQMPPDFSVLDRANAGFLTQKDAAGNPWLSRNFAMCDTDHDNQVSRAEYVACASQPPPP
jgi:hypothetical protein